jgi:hypothetical protein
MPMRTLYCEACRKPTPHQVDDGDSDDGELALCTLCGRLSSPPTDTSSSKSSNGPDRPRCRR